MTIDINDHISLRSVTGDDLDVLLEAYAASREFELSQVPWTDDIKRAFVRHQYQAQIDHYAAHFPAAEHQLIVFEGEAAGRLYIDRRTDEIAVMDLNILPLKRRKGIATAILRGLMSEAAASGRIIGVYLEVFNPAQKLFADLGFTVTKDDGMSRRFEWNGAADHG